MRGFAIAEQPLPAIIVNGKDRTAGRIFTLLHELAHVVLGESAIENDIEPGNAIPPAHRAIERFCNRVAAAALMPLDALAADPIVLAKQQHKGAWSDDEIIAVARHFGVSRVALLVRLAEMGRVSAPSCRRSAANMIGSLRRPENPRPAALLPTNIKSSATSAEASPD
jgi:Zn-dependent peptidase ImmA (M78 family)